MDSEGSDVLWIKRNTHHTILIFTSMILLNLGQFPRQLLFENCRVVQKFDASERRFCYHRLRGSDRCVALEQCWVGGEPQVFGEFDHVNILSLRTPRIKLILQILQPNQHLLLTLWEYLHSYAFEVLVAFVRQRIHLLKLSQPILGCYRQSTISINIG